ncbi:leucine-rich repeat-containing protein 74B [Lingula anatina]|uniref:Leucine-rich repeat-containing protein 74B n=1 Tax=Lingula anatina TaxID=7574 RepID=A0A1S3HM96_LINAN|nr:leucine-rich repeat-containing protein 74B [Lingula anatina]|eukprot:XP_013386159.1 leucine-rich repeat-containing protein 74B [Lingula anatina]
MKEHQDLISQSIILEANGPGSKDNKKVSDNPNLDLYEAMFRQFTFTGYDIMQDEAPKKPVKPKKDTTEIAKYSAIYVDACKKMGLVPVTYLAERLAEKEVEMNSHGLGPQGAKAVAISLVRNDKVQYLSIEDNWIGIEGASYIAEMLTENFTITELNLAENRIGSEGAIDILKVLLENTSIKMLDLSGNGIHDDAMGDLAEVLMENIYLRELRLSHNQIGEDGGPILARALKSNDSLEVLDISWNHLRGKAVTAIAGCLQYNVGLRMLDISWNGFALDGCRVLGKALIANKTLQDLDISSNRLHPQAIAELMKGVKDNQGLVKISISSNPITPKLALAILQSLDKCNPLSELSEVDMWDVVVTQEFVNFLEEMQKKRELVVKYGPIMGKNDHRHYTSDAALGTTDPLEILFNFMTREGMRVVDLFNRFDTDGSSSVSRAEFRDGLLGVNAPLTRGQLDVLLEQLDEDGDGEVDLSELMSGASRFKRRQMRRRLKQLKHTKTAIRKIEKNDEAVNAELLL